MLTELYTKASITPIINGDLIFLFYQLELRRIGIDMNAGFSNADFYSSLQRSGSCLENKQHLQQEKASQHS